MSTTILFFFFQDSPCLIDSKGYTVGMERTIIHHSDEFGWHVDVLPHDSEWAFQVSAPPPWSKRAQSFLVELDRILSIIRPHRAQLENFKT